MSGVGRTQVSRSNSGTRAAGAAQGLLVLALAWGTFAFGAVYPWAYWPLAIAGAAVAAVGLSISSGSGTRKFVPWLLVPPLAGFLVAILLQVIPVQTSLVTAVSPSTMAVVGQLDPASYVGIVTAHPLSIAPRRTFIGALVFGSLALLLVGASRLLSIIGVRATARAIAIMGVVLAFVGIIQQPLSTGKIYGFWVPPAPGLSFGPFVNRNHFAGWMLMGLPVTLGLLCAQVDRGIRDARSGFREKLLWLASAEANGVALLTAAAALMAIALVLTMSRSGMTAAALAVAGIGILTVRAQATGMQKVATLSIIVAIVVLAVTWIGASVISQRFASADWSDFNARKGAWEDAIDVAKRFPLVGTGFNTYGVATLFYQRHDLAQHYAQAHNDYLQLAAEGGVLLTIPAAVAIIALAVMIRRRFQQETSRTTYWIRAGAVTGLCAIAVQETVEFSLQMPGNAFLFVVLCAIAVHSTPLTRRY